MRRVLVLGLVLSAGCFAGGVVRGGGFGGFRGGGFGGFRGGSLGGFHAGGFRSGFAGRGNFSAFFPGGFRTHGFGFRNHRFGFRRFGYGSYGGYPAFWSYGYYDPYYYDSMYQPAAPGYYQQAAPAPQVIVIAPQVAAPAPAAPPAPQISVPEQAPAPEAAPPSSGSGPIYFLVPFKDKTVQAAVAYWIEGSTLHYITVAGADREASLSDIDREAAARLNRGRIIRFRLPPEQ